MTQNKRDKYFSFIFARWCHVEWFKKKNVMHCSGYLTLLNYTKLTQFDQRYIALYVFGLTEGPHYVQLQWNRLQSMGLSVSCCKYIETTIGISWTHELGSSPKILQHKVAPPSASECKKQPPVIDSHYTWSWNLGWQVSFNSTLSIDGLLKVNNACTDYCAYLRTSTKELYAI